MFPSPTRRDLLRIGAVMPALTLPAAGLAQLGAPDRPNAGHFSFTLGEARLTVISDGSLQLPADALAINADRAEVEAFLTRHFLSTSINYAHTNHLLVEIGEAKVLIDVGSGNRFLNTAGRLMDNLGAAGIDPASITHVVITHAHPDHIWGVRDDFDEAILPEAAYFIGQTEHDFWRRDNLVNEVAPELQQFVVGAVNSLDVEGAEWTLLSEGQEVVPGLRVIGAPGHTPGHLGVVVESEGQQLLALGDALTHAWMSFAEPSWVNSFDMDPDQTVATRMRLLDMAASDRMAVLGYHFPFPGVGHVMADAGGYRFVPALWRFD